GEVDLMRGRLLRGQRMPSMMAPTAALAADGRLELVLGAAGGTRLRTALVGVLGAVLYEGLVPQAAIDRPRFHPTPELLNAELGVEEAWLAELESSDRIVRRRSSMLNLLGGVGQ